MDSDQQWKAQWMILLADIRTATRQLQYCKSFDKYQHQLKHDMDQLMAEVRKLMMELSMLEQQVCTHDGNVSITPLIPYPALQAGWQREQAGGGSSV